MIGVIGETYDSLLGLRVLMDNHGADEASLVMDLPVFKGEIYGQEVLCCAGGTSNYLSLASCLKVIDKYHPEAVFVIGEASALSPLLHIGNVVGANRVYIHGANFHALGLPYGTIPGFDPYFFSSIELARQFDDIARDISDVSYGRGDIISGEKKITDQEEFTSIILRRYASKTHLRSYDCNSAGVAMACKLSNVPFLPLRAITYLPMEGSDGLLRERRIALEANDYVAALIAGYCKAKGENR